MRRRRATRHARQAREAGTLALFATADARTATRPEKSGAFAWTRRLLGWLSSLRGKLLTLLLAVFVVALGAVVRHGAEQQDHDVRQATAELRRYAHSIASRQSDQVNATREVMSLLVVSHTLETIAASPDCRDLLDGYRVRQAHIAVIRISTPDGALKCSTVRDAAQPASVADRPFFRAALREGAPVIGDPFRAQSTGRWAVPFAVAYRNRAGVVQLVLTVLLDLHWLRKELVGASLPPGAGIGLIDDQGLVLSRYPDPTGKVGTNVAGTGLFRALARTHGHGTAQATGIDGVEQVLAFEPFVRTPSRNVYLALGVPRASVTHDARAQFVLTILTAVSLLMLTLGLVWIGSERYLLRPVKRINDTARALRRGEFRVRTGVRYRNDELGELARTVDDMAMSLLSNSEILRLNRALQLLAFGKTALVKASNEANMLEDICREVVETGAYCRAWIGLWHGGGCASLATAASHAVGEGARTSGPQAAEPATSLARAAACGAAVQVVEDTDATGVPEDLRADARRNGFRSCAAFPLIAQAGPIGTLVVLSEFRNAFRRDEVELLQRFAGDVAFSIHHLRVREESRGANERLEKSLHDAIRAIATTLEFRDPYTAGHQRRVAALCLAIARDLRMSDFEIKGIQFAATVHDIGKIQVPAEILAKPASLTELEYGLLQLHARAGYDILKDIDFPWPIAEMVWQHHERMNGSGYPRALAGDQILPGARIIGVADTVEAMATHRPFRPARGIEAALEEISAHRGTLYDAAVVDSCLRTFRRGFRFEAA